MNGHVCQAATYMATDYISIQAVCTEWGAVGPCHVYSTSCFSGKSLKRINGVGGPKGWEKRWDAVSLCQVCMSCIS